MIPEELVMKTAGSADDRPGREATGGVSLSRVAAFGPVLNDVATLVRT